MPVPGETGASFSNWNSDQSAQTEQDNHDRIVVWVAGLCQGKGIGIDTPDRSDPTAHHPFVED